MKINNALIVYTTPKSSTERLTLDLIKRVLEKNKINFLAANRENLSSKLFKGNDIVIAVGGDGTFLKASHFIFDNTPMLGVNSNPMYKVGFFMTVDKDCFEEKLAKILDDKHKIRKLHRLEAHVDENKIPEFALNEFYIASEKPYHTARYCLIIRGEKEVQKSSGVLISTAAGSYAWIKSAGGKILPLESDDFEFLVREPYCGKYMTKYSLTKGILKKGEKVEVIFDFGSGVLIADSLSKEHKFKAGQKITIKLSDKPLQSVYFGK